MADVRAGIPRTKEERENYYKSIYGYVEESELSGGQVFEKVMMDILDQQMASDLEALTIGKMQEVEVVPTVLSNPRTRRMRFD